MLRVSLLRISLLRPSIALRCAAVPLSHPPAVPPEAPSAAAAYQLEREATGASAGAVGQSPDTESVLEVVREDAGETAHYYAHRYFDGSEVKVNAILWNKLKKYGHVDLDRGASWSNAPRWFPAARAPRRGPAVRRYNPEDNDLSLLREVKEFTADSVDAAIVGGSDSDAGRLGAELEAALRAPETVAAPAEFGWGSLSNSAAGVRRRGVKQAAQRWKQDINQLKEAAAVLKPPPRMPWR